MTKFWQVICDDILKVIGSILIFIPWYIQVALIEPTSSDIDYRNRLIMAQDVHEIDKNLNNFRLESAVLWHDKNSQFSKPYIDLLFGSTNSMLVETEYMKTSALEEMETDSTEPIFSEFNRLYDSITLYRTNRDSLKLLGILQYYAQYLDSHGSSLKTMTAYYRDRQLTKLKFRKRWFNLCYLIGSVLFALGYIIGKMKEQEKTSNNSLKKSKPA